MTSECEWPCDGMKIQRMIKSNVYMWTKPYSFCQKANQHHFPKCHTVPFQQAVRCMSLQALVNCQHLWLHNQLVLPCMSTGRTCEVTVGLCRLLQYVVILCFRRSQSMASRGHYRPACWAAKRRCFQADCRQQTLWILRGSQQWRLSALQLLNPLLLSFW